MEYIKWALGFMRGKRYLQVIGLSFSLVTSAALVIEPNIMRVIIDDCLVPGNFDMLIPLLAAIVGLNVILTGSRYVMNIFFEKSSQHMLYNIRTTLFAKLQAQSSHFYMHNKSGDLITRMTGDLDIVRHFTAFVLYRWVDCVIMFLACVIMFLTVSPLYTVILLCLTPFTAFVTIRMAKTVRPAYAEVRAQMSKLNSVVQENISGNRVVKAFTREDYEMEKFSVENLEYRRLNMRAAGLWLTFEPFIQSISMVLGAVNIVAGGIMVITGSITLGQLIMFINLAWALNEPMRMVGFLMNDTQRFMASAEKVQMLDLSDPDIQSPEDAVSPEHIRGDVEFRDVRISFDGNEALSGVSFKVKAGETIGIMGPTGSGKTTLINLLARLNDPTGGHVFVDGVDVRRYNLQALRRNIAMAMQDVFLFSDTIDANIAYSNPELPEERVYDFARQADAYDFVSKMPDGFDTIVGERGMGLSGGQKQRVALARALARCAPILVLDDTTSAVDMETEKYIQEKLRESDIKATTIIIAQRITSVRHADCIYVIEDGKITERGRHEELIQNHSGYYYKTFRVQQGYTGDLGALSGTAAEGGAF